MKNNILPCFDKPSGKWAAQLFGYEETPSGSIRPILRVSSEFVFESFETASQYLYDNLKPAVRGNTNWPIQISENQVTR